MAVGVVLAYGAVAFAETTAGWENVSPDRKEFPLARVVWAAPSENLRVEKADGAEGDVRFEGGRIVIRKTNDRGVIRVIAPVAKFDGGRHVRFSADVLACRSRSVNGALGGLSASADGKSFPEYDKFRPERWFGNGGPSMRRMINTAPNTSYRKYTHGVSDSGEIVPAIYVRGAASESTWTNWRAEYNDEAQKLWAEHREKMRMPDRRPEMEPEETFEKALAADTEHSAEIRTVGGRSVFCVDGQPSVPIVYKQSHMFDSPSRYLTYAGRPLHDAGVKIGVIEVHFAGRPDKCQSFWTKDGFDARGLAGRIREEMRIAGPQVFLLAVSLNAYPEFSASCPDEQWRKADGSVACGTFGSVSADYDSGGDFSANKKVWPWVSYASRTYRAAVRKNLTELIAELKRTGLAKRIVGFHLAGFHDGQFAMPFPDYSASAKAEYAAYCKDHPDANFDYFSVQLGFRTQEEFARHIKREFGKPMVGVRWCMTPFGGGSGAHDIVAFTHSDAIDVIVPQTAYMQREPGLATGCNLPIASFNENRKMLWYEFDHRNYSAIDTWGQSIIAQKGLAFAEDDVQWANIDRKHHGMMIALGMGNWYYDMGGGWFRQPGIVREVADVYRFREKLLAKTPDPWRPDVVWVIDEKSICLYNRPGQPKVSGVYRMVGGARETMGASGVPYETRLIEDFQRDPSLAKRYKAAVLAGFLLPDESRRKVMSDLAVAGVKTLVEQARGITSEELNAFASEAGAFVAAKPGLEVDMNGDFVSVHALWTDCWELRLPFACRVINVKSGAEEHPSGNVLKLNLTAGETCWFLLERVRRTTRPREWRGAKMVRRIARSPKRMTTSVVEVEVGEGVTFIRPALAIRAGADVTFGDVRIEQRTRGSASLPEKE